MMDNLQEAYTAYQQALYYLPDPKVCCRDFITTKVEAKSSSGAKTVVRHWDTL